MASIISIPSFFFFRTHRTNSSKKTKLVSSSVPSYSKRVFVAVIVAAPMAFGLNVPLDSMVSFMPIWGVITINAIVIPSYMTFVIPRASKLASAWLNKTQKKEES